MLQGPHKPSSCTTFMLKPQRDRAATGKRSLASMPTGSLRSCPTLCCPVDCGLPGFSVRERCSPDKNPGAYWPILVTIPFWSTVFPAALATNSPEYLELPEPLQPKQLHHLHTWPSQGQTQVLQGPRPDPHAEVEIKPQLKPKGQVAKEEDLKPSHCCR